MPKSNVSATNLPSASDHDPHASIAGQFVYISGQIGLSPITNTLVDGGVFEEAVQVFKNLTYVLELSGSEIDQLVQMTIYLHNSIDVEVVNTVATSFFKSTLPSCSIIGDVKLPQKALVMIDGIALKKA